MTNVILDTSVAVKWFFPETGKDKALELKDQHITGKINLCTRELFLYEFTSALRNYTLQPIEEKDFAVAVATIQSLKLKIFPLEFKEMEDLYTCSKKLQLSIYDCSYLLLAQKLRGTFYTADRKLYLKAKDFVSSVNI